MPKFNVAVQLTGQNGNAFVLIGLVRRALEEAGATREQIRTFVAEATSGDYDHLLVVCTEWVDVH